MSHRTTFLFSNLCVLGPLPPCRPCSPPSPLHLPPPPLPSPSLPSCLRHQEKVQAGDEKAAKVLEGMNKAVAKMMELAQARLATLMRIREINDLDKKLITMTKAGEVSPPPRPVAGRRHAGLLPFVTAHPHHCTSESRHGAAPPHHRIGQPHHCTAPSLHIRFSAA